MQWADRGPMNNQNSANYRSALSEFELNRLDSTKTPPSELRTDIATPYDLIPELVSYTRLSWEEECESSAFKPRDYYNYLIKPDQIDYVFPANDQQLFETFHSKKFLNHVGTLFFVIFCYMITI